MMRCLPRWRGIKGVEKKEKEERRKEKGERRKKKGEKQTSSTIELRRSLTTTKLSQKKYQIKKIPK